MILEINNRQANINRSVFLKSKKMLRFSLSRLEGVLSKVKVHFSDVNGPKGGVDKRCRISAQLINAGQIIVLGEGKNFLSALKNCLGRLVRSTRRELEKSKHFIVRPKRRIYLLATTNSKTFKGGSTP